MTRTDHLWITAMEWCSKYWGCHQIPDRSFFIAGYQFPVCARCTGIIAGELMAIIISMFIVFPVYVCFVLMIPMTVDGLIQYKTKYLSTNPRRFCTGFFFGYGLVSIAIIEIQFIIKSLQGF